MQAFWLHVAARWCLRGLFLCTLICAIAPLCSARAFADTCPVALKSLVLAAKGMSGREVTYRLDASIAQNVLAPLSLDVKTSLRTNVLDWSPAVDSKKPFPQMASEWLPIVAAERLESVSLPDNSVGCSPSGPLTPTNGGDVTVYDDTRTHDSLADAGPAGLPVIHDSDFVQQAQPDYPEIAKDQDVVGDVEIEVEIGPQGGRARDAWVRWDLESGGGRVLADASLAAARASRFSVPMVGGQPTARRYLIIYTFRLDVGQGITSIDVPDDFSICPLVVDELRVEPAAPPDPNAWYFLSTKANGDNIASAVLALQDTSGHVTGYPWKDPNLTPADDENKKKRWTASATFNWSGAPIQFGWVDTVMLSDGKTYSCLPIGEKWTAASDEPIRPRIIVGQPLPLIAMQSTRPASFVNEVWPDYPAGADGTRAAGRVAVETIVGDHGLVLDAFVTASSGRNELDLAAINAAQASTYAAAEPHGLRIYSTTYRFVP